MKFFRFTGFFLTAILLFIFLSFPKTQYAQDYYYINNGQCVKTQELPNAQYWSNEKECNNALSNNTTVGGGSGEYSYKINNLDVYANPEKVAEMYEHAETRIDGNTHSVWVTFTGLDPTKDYFICGSDDKKTCRKSNSANAKPNEQGEITFNVCGNGKNSLKGVQVSAYNSTEKTGGKLKEQCKDGRDYFHEGQTYHLTVFDYYRDEELRKDIDSKLPFINIGVADVISAEFFVAHSYPLVRVNSVNALTNSLDVTLWGRRPGDGNDNNYQLVLEGIDHKYKKERCYQLPGKSWEKDNETVGVDTQYVSKDGKTPNEPKHIFDGTGWGVPRRPDDKGQSRTFGNAADKEIGPIGRGLFILKVNERVSDNRPLNFAETCEGGHTFMHIFFKVTNTPQSTNGIEIVKVEYDPNKSDGDDIEKTAPAPKAPCAADSYDKATDTCKAFDVALLGKVPLEPLPFIKAIYTIVLSLAGVAAMAIIIRAAYKFMYSRGDKEIISQARSQLTSAIIGLAFIIFAYVILSVIGVDILKIPGFG